MKKESSIRPQPSEAQQAQLDRLSGAADVSDIPEAPEAHWATARRLYRPRKEAISLRLDADVLDWLRRRDPKYQTAINTILRERMEVERTAGR